MDQLSSSSSTMKEENRMRKRKGGEKNMHLMNYN